MGVNPQVCCNFREDHGVAREASIALITRRSEVRILPPLLLKPKGLAATRVPFSLAANACLSPKLYPVGRNRDLPESKPPRWEVRPVASLKIRGGVYYAQYYVGGKQKRVSLETDVLQIAKEKIRQIESSLSRGGDLPLSTRTPIADIVTPYVAHVRAVKTAKSAQTDVYYLREVFGQICDALTITSRKVGAKSKKRPLKEGQDRRRRAQVIETKHFEQITTADISSFVSAQVQSRGLAPKTANRYREILCRLFNWSVEHRGVRLPNDRNPAKHVHGTRSTPRKSGS